MYRNPEFLKAVAFAMYIKGVVVSSSVNDCSYQKLHRLTGLSVDTIKKRLRILKEDGLISYAGKNNRCLVFGKLSSNCNHRNFEITHLCSNSIKEIERSLQALLIVLIQKRKDFARQTIQTARNGYKLNDVKRAKKLCKRYGWGTEYKERGLSYKGIAARIGCSVKTAFEIVKFAVLNEFLTKTRHINQFFARGIGQIKDKIGNYTFITRNNVYTVWANSYAVIPHNPAGNN